MNYEDVAKAFVIAGRGDKEITPKHLYVLGLRKQDTFKSTKYGLIKVRGWENVCIFVHEKLTGNPHPGSQLMGRGFRSKDFGDIVAKAIRDHFKLRLVKSGCMLNN